MNFTFKEGLCVGLKKDQRRWPFIFSMSLCLSLGGLLLTASQAQATMTNGIHQHYFSPRAMAMGNAFTSMSDDYNTLLFNPAGLAHIPEWQLNVELVGGGVSMGDNKILDFIDDVNAANDKSGDEQTTALAQLAERNYGKNYYLRAQSLNSVWVKNNWGVAFLPLDFSLNLGVHQQVGPTFDVEAIQDTTLAIGRAWKLDSLLQGLSVGVTLKTIYRAYFSKVLPAVELTSGSNAVDSSDADEGLTFDLDLGALYQLPQFLGVTPLASLVVRNAIDYGFSTNFHLLDDNSTRAPKLQRRLDVGSAFLLPHFVGLKPAVTLDIRDMGHDNWTFKKGLHLGTELKWALWKYLNLALRGGINQGYGTFGLGLKALWLAIDFVSYGEEIGTKDVKTENRVYFARVSFDF